MANLGQPYRDSLVSLESPKKKLSRALASRLMPFSSPPCSAAVSRTNIEGSPSGAGWTRSRSSCCSRLIRRRLRQLLARPPSPPRPAAHSSAIRQPRLGRRHRQLFTRPPSPPLPQRPSGRGLSGSLAAPTGAGAAPSSPRVHPMVRLGQGDDGWLRFCGAGGKAGVLGWTPSGGPGRRHPRLCAARAPCSTMQASRRWLPCTCSTNCSNRCKLTHVQMW